MNDTVRVTMNGCYWGILAEFGLLERFKVSALYDAANDKPDVSYDLTAEEIRAIRNTVSADKLNAVGFPNA